MMPRIQRSPEAIAARQKIASHPRVNIYVEGIKMDRPYYDALLDEVGIRSDVKLSIRHVDEIKVDVSQRVLGGKHAVISARNYFVEHNLIRDDPETATPNVLFIIDRDFVLPGRPEDEKSYLIYSHHCDVESDIYVNTDVLRAIANAYSITKVDVIDTLGENWDPVHRLLYQVAEFVEHIVKVINIAGKSSGRFSKVTFVQEDDDIVVDKKIIQQFIQDALQELDSYPLGDCEWVEEAIQNLKSRQAETRIIKGKWITSYILACMRLAPKSFPIQANVRGDALLSAALGSLSFRPDTIAYYRRRLSNYNLLATTK